MAYVSAEQMIDWTTPPDWQITPHCLSEAEFHELRDWTKLGRQGWLLDILRRREAQLNNHMAERGPSQAPEPREHNWLGTDPYGTNLPPEDKQYGPPEPDYLPMDSESTECEPTGPVSFEDIPAKSVLSRTEHYEIVSNDNWIDEAKGRSSWTHGDINYRKHHWQIMAARCVALSGYQLGTSKYDERMYTDTPQAEIDFACAYKMSQQLSADGFSVQLLTDGIRFASQAALDLDSLEAWLSTSTDRPALHFWPQVLAIKRERDKKNKIKTFADQVILVSDGLYIAQYLPAEVKASGEYITFDDVMRVAIEHGYKEIVAGSFFKAAILSTVDRQDWKNYLRWNYFDRLKGYLHPGVILLDRKRLPGIVEGLHEQESNAVKKKALAELVLAYYTNPSETPTSHSLYDQLVLGKH